MLASRRILAVQTLYCVEENMRTEVKVIRQTIALMTHIPANCNRLNDIWNFVSEYWLHVFHDSARQPPSVGDRNTYQNRVVNCIVLLFTLQPQSIYIIRYVMRSKTTNCQLILSALGPIQYQSKLMMFTTAQAAHNIHVMTSQSVDLFTVSRTLLKLECNAQPLHQSK